MFRQGDVLLIPVDKIPDDVRAVATEPDGRIVLAHGEVTGHAHAVVGECAFLENDAGDRFLELAAEGAIVHEEHGTIEIAGGAYEVRRQREYSPEAIRNVAD